MAQLSLADFVKYKDEPSAEMRAKIASEMCAQFNDSVFTEKEKQLVSEILSLLSRDVEVSIRRILAESLKESEDLPHDAAMRLAKDVDEVANPILEFSSVLTEEDLIEIVRSTEAVGKLKAVARRNEVPEIVSAELVNKKNEEVVTTLIKNKTAHISEETFETVIEDFKGSESVLSELVSRGNLSTTLAEKMVSMVSVKLQKQLVGQYGVNPRIAKTAMADTKEETTLGLISKKADAKSTIELVNHLHNSKKLNHSIVLRALCKGDVDFFEAGIAKLAGIPIANARKLIHAGDEQGFAALFRAASMPNTMLDATKILLKLTLKHLEKEEAEKSDSNHANTMIERIVAAGYDKDIPNMRYLMTLIGSNKPLDHSAA